MSRRHIAHILVLCFTLSAALAITAPLASAAEAEPSARLPRFVSLRSDQVNLRVGPGENYPIQWVLTRKEMPVEIIKEFEHWRMIRDWPWLDPLSWAGVYCSIPSTRRPRRATS